MSGMIRVGQYAALVETHEGVQRTVATLGKVLHVRDGFMVVMGSVRECSPEAYDTRKLVEAAKRAGFELIGTSPDTPRARLIGLPAPAIQAIQESRTAFTYEPIAFAL